MKIKGEKRNVNLTKAYYIYSSYGVHRGGRRSARTDFDRFPTHRTRASAVSFHRLPAHQPPPGYQLPPSALPSTLCTYDQQSFPNSISFSFPIDTPFNLKKQNRFDQFPLFPSSSSHPGSPKKTNSQTSSHNYPHSHHKKRTFEPTNYTPRIFKPCPTQSTNSPSILHQYRNLFILFAPRKKIDRIDVVPLPRDTSRVASSIPPSLSLSLVNDVGWHVIRRRRETAPPPHCSLDEE